MTNARGSESFPRRLILLLDGTWNDADVGSRDTNIVRIRELIASCLDKKPAPMDVAALSTSLGSTAISSRTFTVDNNETEYVLFYERGVGTGGFFDLYRGGAFGAGLGRNVRRAYRFLSNNYREGDEIFIFGFSRGSYTARSLVGYLSAVGLLKRESLTPETESRAWYFYRTNPADRLMSIADDIRMDAYPQGSIRIKLLGVFDTVGAMGVPLGTFWRENRDLFEFHDVGLSSLTDVCLHAVAIDEHRESFQATLWRTPKFETVATKAEQTWFTGAHSDIGGGYVDATARQSLASKPLDDITLDWMLRRVMAMYKDFPITIIGNDGKTRVPAWRLTDSTWVTAEQHEARLGFYKLTPYSWRSIGNVANASKKWPPEIDVCLDRHSDAAGERIHRSAIERLGRATPSGREALRYAPKNLINALGLKATSPAYIPNVKVVDWTGEEMTKADADTLISQAKARMTDAGLLD